MFLRRQSSRRIHPRRCPCHPHRPDSWVQHPPVRHGTSTETAHRGRRGRNYQPAFGVLDLGTADARTGTRACSVRPSATLPGRSQMDGDGVDELLLGQMTQDINNRTLACGAPSWGLWPSSRSPRAALPGRLLRNKFLSSMSLAVADANETDTQTSWPRQRKHPRAQQLAGSQLPVRWSSRPPESGPRCGRPTSGFRWKDDRIGSFDLCRTSTATTRRARPTAARAVLVHPRAEAGHHRISEVGRPLSPDVDDQEAVYGVGDTNGDGSPDVVVGFFDGVYSLEPRLFLGDLR